MRRAVQDTVATHTIGDDVTPWKNVKRYRVGSQLTPRDVTQPQTVQDVQHTFAGQLRHRCSSDADAKCIPQSVSDNPSETQPKCL
eukprot:CAMPEP_0204495192 /NCGR_PEP_ID=MMETSP0471-20130131/85869_1 /ASSEMBLY_ACC=CAM_ASM_000602 /TAXON_ID=2969 /ORGANISM="Oxyrrhis marina" /LENGTH=84 /DNA_ID=CAMNT_0051499431 /DNA_START=638 /DNA_END=888 /DNA_ORIENTATION=+